MAKKYCEHVDYTVQITEGPGQLTNKPGGIGTLDGLLDRVQGQPDDQDRELVATRKGNGYRLYVEFTPDGNIQAFTSGGHLSEEFTDLLRRLHGKHEFKPEIFRNSTLLLAEGMALVEGQTVEVGHAGMRTALKIYRECMRNSLDPLEVGLRLEVWFFAISRYGSLKAYQMKSKALELQKLRGMLPATNPGVLKTVEAIVFRLERDGRILDETGTCVCTRSDFARHLLDQHAGDGEGFVVYARNTPGVAGGQARFGAPDKHGKRRSKTASKVLFEFTGVMACRREEDRAGDLALGLYTTHNTHDRQTHRVGTIPIPSKCPGLSEGQAVLYRLRFTWVYATGSVAGVKTPWDQPSPDVIAFDRAHEKVTPISEIVAGSRHWTAVQAQSVLLARLGETRLPQVLRARAEARTAPDTRTTREILDTTREVLHARAHKFLPADSRTMLAVQAARAADRTTLTPERVLLADYLSLSGPSNDPKDSRASNETVLLTVEEAWSQERYAALCEQHQGRQFRILGLQWLTDSLREGVYQPTDGYSVVQAAKQAKRPLGAEAGREVAQKVAPEPAQALPEPCSGPTPMKRCYTNGLGKESER